VVFPDIRGSHALPPDHAPRGKKRSGIPAEDLQILNFEIRQPMKIAPADGVEPADLRFSLHWHFLELMAWSYSTAPIRQISRVSALFDQPNRSVERASLNGAPSRRNAAGEVLPGFVRPGALVDRALFIGDTRYVCK
jgi:hypothetical protein